MELLLPLAVAFGFLWLMTRRTRKMQKETTAFRENLVPGQEVMTGSGLFGTVVAAEGDVVTIETSPGVTSRWLRAAIAKLVDPPVEDDEVVDDATTAYVTGDRVPDDASSLTADPRDPDDVDRR
ncbi:preprotein translocase subunit YajC [Actinotalea ferrariae CF5-4]|uniref:Preprotein translocase subunit YajC n=1 Tax=Actinotalea ferrariae CF5-4 TaxID=948458 RepID=A0A021VWU1_9CELL|nr:preprotein translocase subunit YajC [Actinotalea ferrariae]EYR64480.1 preprotein translocase subunit YajC [Actinotalea ferrariae CF5-4]